MVEQRRRRHRTQERDEVQDDVVDRRDEATVQYMGDGNDKPAGEGDGEKETDHDVGATR